MAVLLLSGSLTIRIFSFSVYVHISSTQAIIALSSGEAGFYGIVKGASVLLGACSLARDLGIELRGRVYTDSSAAKGIASTPVLIGADGIGIEILGKTRDLRIVGNVIEERREPLQRTGIRIDREVGKLELADNRIEGFAKAMDDQRVAAG